VLRKEQTQREIGVSLTTPTKLEELRAKLYAKAKAEPTFRFYALYDKIHRWDVLTEALGQSKQKRGAAGVDGQTFEQLKEYGEERWLEELQRELQEKTYRPQPVRRVLIPKPGGASGHWAYPRSRIEWSRRRRSSSWSPSSRPT